MSGTGSISALLHLLKDGDHEAASQLWQRYYPRLVALARQKLQDPQRRVADEEDATLSALDSPGRKV